jgi:TatD DNase family protein
MFRGEYNGKRVHPSDLPDALQRGMLSPASVFFFFTRLIIITAWNVGVEKIMITGGSLQESREALELALTNGTQHTC